MGFKVLTAEIGHETNTFSIRPTNLQAFRDQYLMAGSEAIAVRGEHNTNLAGFCDAQKAYGWSISHIISANAGPGGRVTKEAFDTIVAPLVAAAARGSYDGILLGLHGAMVPAFCEDGEGEILRRLRALVGRDLPIAITLDPHANVTAQMCDLADIIVSYNTYPHIDMRQTGRRAADILHRTMTGEISPRTICVHRPMLEEVNGGRTDIGPMIARHAAARSFEKQDDVFAVSINAGFASADIAEVGPSVLVTGQGDPVSHIAFADTIANDIWACRTEVLNDYLGVTEAAQQASDWPTTNGPLVIADYADNPGAGAYGDSTALLAALLDKNVTGACFGPLIDPVAVRELGASPMGSHVRLKIGGRTAPNFGGGPLAVEGELIWRGSGKVVGEGSMSAGIVTDFGPSAVLRVAGLDILIVTLAHQILDLAQFTTFGIDPARKRVVALKSMQHFRAAFAPVAGKIIVCDSGALCTMRYARLPYKNVARPIFPLDPI